MKQAIVIAFLPLDRRTGAALAASSSIASRRFGRIVSSMRVARQQHFVYAQSVDVEASSIAAAIGEPARARMLYCLMDGHARTSTELAIVADVSPSTASVHLNRLKAESLVRVLAQGKHRYYSLEGTRTA